MVFALIKVLTVNSVLVVKSGEHYDAIVPSNITLSSIPINHNRDITFSHNKMNSISQHSRISGNKKVLPDNTIDFQYNTFRIAGLNVCGLRSKLHLELRAAAAGIVRQPQGGCRRPPRIAFRNMVFTV